MMFYLCYFLLNIIIFFSTYFFDNITLCISIPNVTSSNMSHLVYITCFGETDGVTLSRLGCIGYTYEFVCIIAVLYPWYYTIVVYNSPKPYLV